MTDDNTTIMDEAQLTAFGLFFSDFIFYFVF